MMEIDLEVEQAEQRAYEGPHLQNQTDLRNRTVGRENDQESDHSKMIKNHRLATATVAAVVSSSFRGNGRKKTKRSGEVTVKMLKMSLMSFWSQIRDKMNK
jgi:hypothetical protein